MTGNSWIFLYMKILESAAPRQEAQELFQEKKDRSGEARALNVLADIYCDLREAGVATCVVCPIDIRFPFHLFASFCAYARPARLMRILQPQTESGPSFFFFIFLFCFSFFPVSYHSPIMWICKFSFFFILQSCVILICLSCFPHVCS